MAPKGWYHGANRSYQHGSLGVKLDCWGQGKVERLTAHLTNSASICAVGRSRHGCAFSGYWLRSLATFQSIASSFRNCMSVNNCRYWSNSLKTARDRSRQLNRSLEEPMSPG